MSPSRSPSSETKRNKTGLYTKTDVSGLLYSCVAHLGEQGPFYGFGLFHPVTKKENSLAFCNHYL